MFLLHDYLFFIPHVNVLNTFISGLCCLLNFLIGCVSVNIFIAFFLLMFIIISYDASNQNIKIICR
jgi:hypothetical protein